MSVYPPVPDCTNSPFVVVLIGAYVMLAMRALSYVCKPTMPSEL